MKNDGYVVVGESFDLEFDSFDSYSYEHIQRDVRNLLNKNLLTTIDKTVTREILANAVGKIAFGNSSIKVESVDWMPETGLATISVAYAPSVAISSIITNLSFPEDPIDWDSFSNSKEAKDIRNTIGKIYFTKARLLMRKVLPKDFKQLRSGWIKTVYVFTFYSQEELVEFLLDPSETVREAAKLRIKQIENY